MGEKRFKKTIVGDVIVIALLLLVAFVSALTVFLTHDKGAWCAVSVDGKTLAAFPLSENTEYTVFLDDGKNTLTIKDGKAYMSFADCPDKICVAHKPISLDGESIVCLPHKVVVSISEDKPQTEGEANE